MFTIVTHHAPDLDAITAAWLIKRFLPNWQDADVVFVPAGKTLNNEIPDSDPKILHVDTGFGMLDHHQTDEKTCAGKKTYKYLTEKLNKSNPKSINPKKSPGVLANPPPRWEDEALERMCEVVNFYDHFGEATQPDAQADYHVFEAISILDGLKSAYPDDDWRVLEFGLIMLDAIYKSMKEKVWAEEIIEAEGKQFNTIWGKGIGFETINDGVLKQAQKRGFPVVVRKDPKKGYVRIKGSPNTAVDFTQAYYSLQKKDPAATWFLHSSKKILLNGTTKNPDMKPTKLSLNEIIEVLKGKPSASLRH